ncbi:DUF805 domain-containing protein [Bartonella sp. HY329]|uniref:DUF805 domain-containing protein n=1 Tax=unclassified Bartonella TaxID=2645622 RepID=UPI0021C7B4AD|nr:MULTISPECIES: DUF805 domain-containing protein [unclassified Bartonella]UXM95993.1 DUF805 domain-containing protein [Bartonella sp. HY329]UXN10318.1 DUF805 domain-containing protein [Bartonella sp. HY328]
MTFGTAVKVVFLEKNFTLSGRATRSEYWWSILFQVIAVALIFLSLELLVKILPFSSRGADLFENLTILFTGLVFLVPMTTVQVRRLHDRDMSGAWVIIPLMVTVFIQLYDFIEFFFEDYLYYFLPSSPFYYPAWAAFCCLLFLDLIIFISLIFDGTYGANKYGEDPLATKIDQQVFR